MRRRWRDDDARRSTQRLRVVGRALTYANTLFCCLLLLAALGGFHDNTWIFNLTFICVVALGVGWIVAALHLRANPGDKKYNSLWWWRLFFSGPMAPGWHLSSLRDERKG